MVGRHDERAHLAEVVAALPSRARSVVLVGEAGIGKTTLWWYAVDLARESGATVLVSRPSEEDRDDPLQGLADLWAGADVPPGGVGLGELLAPDVSTTQRCHLTLQHLAALADRAPLLVAVDDLPNLDDPSGRALRFALRRLTGRPVALLATARTWSPDALTTPIRPLEPEVEVLALPPMPSGDLRRVVRASVPAATTAAAIQACDLAHGNPFFATELARLREGAQCQPLIALRRRLDALGPATAALVGLLAVAGPSPLRVLEAASGREVTDALRAALDADLVVLDADAVVRFSHPLIATAALAGLHALDRVAADAALARVLTDPDARALHRARATLGVDGAVSAEAEVAAVRAAGRGSPRRAAELFGHAARLTGDDPEAQARRTMGQMVQLAAGGDLPSASALADDLLARLPAGPERGAVVAARVVTDFTDAEPFLRTALGEVPEDDDPDHQRLRGRLLGLLGWLLALHLGRPEEGRRYAAQGLRIGREVGDRVLIAQSASALSTAMLLRGERADDLLTEAIAHGPEVIGCQLALWPQVLAARQQLWDGHLDDARAGFTSMLAGAAAKGAQFQRPYRLVDLAIAAVAAGELDLASEYAAEGMDVVSDTRDDRAIGWLAYPSGLVAALRGRTDEATWCAERLVEAARATDERPRLAMAHHIRGLLAAARQDWSTGLDHLRAGIGALDELGYAHPGAVPLAPMAGHLATLCGDVGELEHLERRWAQAEALNAPWVRAHHLATTGQLELAREDPAAVHTLDRARSALEALGYRLEAATTACLQVAAGLRFGARRAARPVADVAHGVLHANGVRGWADLAAEQVVRLRGAAGESLTATETQIAGLVAEGRRNAEIASRLFVSESTVEAHLTRMYRKLALRGRAELARWVVERE